MPSYAIVGAGAVGGLYGALLRRSGREVHFLLRSDYAHVKLHGLRVDSPLGDFRLEASGFYSDPEAMPPCDVVVIAWKTTQNGQLPRVLPRLVKPGGTVLVLQNGLDPEREASAAAGEARVMAGLCFLCSRREGPGWIRHLDYGAITLAAYAEHVSPGITGEMQAVAADFREAGVEIRLEKDWRQARWRKLVWNVPFNGLCALLGADTARLMAEAPTRSLVRALMEEVLAGAAACGCPLPSDFPDKMLAATDAMAPYEPSMKLDRDSGRPMELHAIYGRTLEEIRRNGGQAPRMEALYAQLRRLESAEK
jgi:2-dehydropantoate 2-reductase